MKHTFLAIDLHAYVDVYADDDQVAEDIERSHTIQYVWIIEWDFLAGLHHDQDDDQVGTTGLTLISINRAQDTSPATYICGFMLAVVRYSPSKLGVMCQRNRPKKCCCARECCKKSTSTRTDFQKWLACVYAG